jgi:hypothetical protein
MMGTWGTLVVRNGFGNRNRASFVFNIPQNNGATLVIFFAHNVFLGKYAEKYHSLRQTLLNFVIVGSPAEPKSGIVG